MEPPTDPTTLIETATTGQPGWSDAYGGPLGVAQAAVAAQEELKSLASVVAGLRAAAIQEALTTRSVADVAKDLGVSRQAVYIASRAPLLHVRTW